jgi:hypothetical protein
MRALADKHGIKAAGLMRRAAKEEWEAQRKQKSAEISKAASVRITDSNVDALVTFNEADLKIARAIREKAETMMAEVTTPSDLRALAAAVDTAQKVGRLALGATTGNTGLSAPNGGPVGIRPVHDLSDDDLADIALSGGG